MSRARHQKKSNSFPSEQPVEAHTALLAPTGVGLQAVWALAVFRDLKYYCTTIEAQGSLLGAMATEPVRALRLLRILTGLLVISSLWGPTKAAGRKARRPTVRSRRAQSAAAGSTWVQTARSLSQATGQQHAQGQQRCPKVSKELLATRSRNNTVMFAVVRRGRACACLLHLPR